MYLSIPKYIFQIIFSWLQTHPHMNLGMCTVSSKQSTFQTPCKEVTTFYKSSLSFWKAYTILNYVFMSRRLYLRSKIISNNLDHNLCLTIIIIFFKLYLPIQLRFCKNFLGLEKKSLKYFQKKLKLTL